MEDSSMLPKPSLVKSLMSDTGKRMEGMQRELYALLGANTPPAVILNENKFKEKPSWKQRAVPWSLEPFTNPARKDGLVLRHWMRSTEKGDQVPYAFAKYNEQIQVPEFDRDEYAKGLENESWTYEETVYLMDLCKEYDLRWLVISDRFDWNPTCDNEMDVDTVATTEEPVKSPETQVSAKTGVLVSNDRTIRTVEDLKERYYEVSRKLMKLRNETLSPAQQEVYDMMEYKKANELKRKQHLSKLLERSPAEIAEEEALVLESRKLEAEAETMMHERAELLRLLDSPQPSGSIVQFQTSQGLASLTSTLLAADKSKRQRKDTPDPTGSVPSGSASQQFNDSSDRAGSSNGSSNIVKQVGNNRYGSNPAVKLDPRNPASMLAAAIQRKLSAKEEAALGISFHDKLVPGVYLRSSKISTYKPQTQQKINAVLSELNLPSRPVMPTARVCAKFESLQNSILVLLEAKKQADKLETEIAIARDPEANTSQVKEE